MKTRQGVRLYRMSPNAPWTYRKHKNGRNHYFQLGFDRAEARKVANEIHNFLYFQTVENAMAKFQPGKKIPGSKGIPTFGDVIDRMKEVAPVSGIAKRTLNAYVGALKLFARVAHPSTPDEKSVKAHLSDLIPELVIKVRRELLEGVNDEDVRRSKMRTANSLQRNCAACFGRTFRPHMTEFDLSCVREFLDVPLLSRLQKRDELPSSDLIKKTFELYDDYEGYEKVMLGLALFFGMRRDEIFHCRKSWFMLEDKAFIKIRADKKFRPKAGVSGMTWGRLEVAERLLELSGKDYVIPIRKRRSTAKKVVSDLRGVGWKRRSPLHECRKLYGSYLANKDSLYAAQKALRHASPQVTSDSYADIMLDNSVTELWETA